MTWTMVAAVAAFGSLGSVARLLLVNSLRLLWGESFPFGVFVVNCLGSFLIGFIFSLASHKTAISPTLQAAIMVGFIGGFTTFSSFSLDTVCLIQNGEIFKALSYVVLSMLACLSLTWAGMVVGRL